MHDGSERAGREIKERWGSESRRSKDEEESDNFIGQIIIGVGGGRPSGSSPVTFEVPKVRVSDEKFPGVYFHKPSGHFPEVEGP